MLETTILQTASRDNIHIFDNIISDPGFSWSGGHQPSKFAWCPN